MKIVKAKDGTPVVLSVADHRRGCTGGGRTKKEDLKKKGLLGKLPKSEVRLLTLRQREGLKNFIDAGLDPAKKAECAIAAGYAPGPAAATAIDNVLAKPFIRERIKDALEKAGVNYDRIADVIAEGLAAEHPTAALRYDPETGDLKAPKDYNAIARFLKEAIDLHDLRPETKIKQTLDKRVVTINLTADDGAAFSKFKRMRQEAALEASSEGV